MVNSKVPNLLTPLQSEKLYIKFLKDYTFKMLILVSFCSTLVIYSFPQKSCLLRISEQLGVVLHAFNPSNGQVAPAIASLRLRPA